MEFARQWSENQMTEKSILMMNLVGLSVCTKFAPFVHHNLRVFGKLSIDY